jgi:hypothetical protein
VSADALFDLLEPVGTLLTVVAHVEITGGIVVDVPMGVFVIDTVKLSAGDGKVSVTAPDKWVRVQRAQFLPRGRRRRGRGVRSGGGADLRGHR